MTNDMCTGVTEHTVSIQSVQVWKGQFDADSLTEDGELSQLAEEMEFQDETSISFECSCGKRFRKFQTATHHLRNVRPDTEHE